MRADRLISLLMLLQARGQMTAAELAAELEVTERTIYRDLTALSASGVPVFTLRGPGGGVALVDAYRTTLTGLTPEEARALFMMSVPAPLLQLGVGGEFKAALRKLSAALPDSRRMEEIRTRARIHLDSSWWFQAKDVPPALSAVQQALWQDHRLRLTIRLEFFSSQVEQEIAPYGLVAKAGIWYLVYGRSGGIHVVRVSQVIRADVLSETFTRPEDFELAAFWERWCEEYESRPPFLTRVRAAPDLLKILPLVLGERLPSPIVSGIELEQDGWGRLTLAFESFFEARTRLLGLGRAVEVLEPEPLRLSLVDFAGQIVDFYQEKAGFIRTT